VGASGTQVAAQVQAHCGLCDPARAATPPLHFGVHLQESVEGPLPAPMHTSFGDMRPFEAMSREPSGPAASTVPVTAIARAWTDQLGTEKSGSGAVFDPIVPCGPVAGQSAASVSDDEGADMPE
jgi:hypothetical protein